MVLMVMSDANYVLGNQKFISCLISLSFIYVNVLGGGCIQYMEYNHMLEIVIYFNSIRNNTIDNKLIPKYRSKFYLKDEP